MLVDFNNKWRTKWIILSKYHFNWFLILTAMLQVYWFQIEQPLEVDNIPERTPQRLMSPMLVLPSHLIVHKMLCSPLLRYHKCTKNALYHSIRPKKNLKNLNSQQFTWNKRSNESNFDLQIIGMSLMLNKKQVALLNQYPARSIDLLSEMDSKLIMSRN